MKKEYALTLVLVLVAILCTGCGGSKLPENFDKSELSASAENFIEGLDSRDYEYCYSQFAEVMTSAMTLTELQETFDSILDNLGDFDEIKSISFSSANSLGVDYAVCTVKCAYANGDAVYTISYDEDMKVGGLYIK